MITSDRRVRLSSASPVRRATAWAAMISLVALSVWTPVHAQRQPGTGLKAAPLDVGAVQPFAEALMAFDQAARRNQGKVQDATRRLADLEKLAPAAKTEIQSFVSRLRQANESAAFDAFVYSQTAESGRPTLAAEIRAEGGPSALLAKAGTLIDQLIAERRKAGSVSSLDRVLETLGLTAVLSAGFWTTACGATFWVLTVGRGTNLAYKACYY